MIDTCRPVFEITMDYEHGLEVERQETANGNRIILLTPVLHILARFRFPQTATARTILKYYGEHRGPFQPVICIFSDDLKLIRSPSRTSQ